MFCKGTVAAKASHDEAGEVGGVDLKADQRQDVAQHLELIGFPLTIAHAQAESAEQVSHAAEVANIGRHEELIRAVGGGVHPAICGQIVEAPYRLIAKAGAVGLAGLPPYWFNQRTV
jgi:hypothetical protein